MIARIIPAGFAKNRLNVIAAVLAFAVTLLGALVIAGWYSRNTAMIQIHPQFAAMQFNTALCFVLTGLGITSAGLEHRKTASVIGAIVLLIGSVTAAQYVFRVNTRLDQLFMEYYITAMGESPGRMGPETALCFMLSGTALLVFGSVRVPEITETAGELIGLIIVAMGIMSLAAYAANATHQFGWGGITRMALHTSAGFVMAGVGIVCVSWSRAAQSVKFLPVAVLSVLCILIVLWDLLSPVGTAIGIAYILVIMGSYWFERRSAPIVFALVATFLIVLGYLTQAMAFENQAQILTNRALSVFVIWITAALVYWQKQTQRQLAENESRLGNVIEFATDGLITTDERGRVETFNPAAEKIFGYEAKEVIGNTVKMLMPGVYSLEHDQYFRNYNASSAAKITGNSGEVTGLRRDGTEFALELGVSEINDPERRVYSAIIRDVSERKISEGKLQRTLRKLEASNEDLEKFAYIASHDLKSPLRAIDNLSTWLAEDLEGKLNEANQGHIDKLRGRVKRMENLLDSLLEFSRAGQKVDQDDIISGFELAEEIIGLLNVPEGFNVEFSPALKELEILRMPLEQVLHNLISNALKHHDRDTGTVNVAVRDIGDFYEFTVSDDGRGIPDRYHIQIFEMFQTLRRRDEVEGSGMGLALVKKIVHRMGGQVKLTSEEGQGATFMFTWPKKIAS